MFITASVQNVQFFKLTVIFNFVGSDCICPKYFVTTVENPRVGLRGRASRRMTLTPTSTIKFTGTRTRVQARGLRPRPPTQPPRPRKPLICRPQTAPNTQALNRQGLYSVEIERHQYISLSVSELLIASVLLLLDVDSLEAQLGVGRQPSAPRPCSQSAARAAFGSIRTRGQQSRRSSFSWWTRISKSYQDVRGMIE